MRPRTLQELVGHEAVVGEGTLLRQAIERDQLFSLVLWAPPGSGKTTLARLIANATEAHFVAISAVFLRWRSTNVPKIGPRMADEMLNAPPITPVATTDRVSR